MVLIHIAASPKFKIEKQGPNKRISSKDIGTKEQDVDERITSENVAIEEQNIDARITSENVGFTLSEVEERLLRHDEIPVSENPRNLSIINDFTASANLRRSSNDYVEATPVYKSSITEVSFKNYAPKILWDHI